MVPSLSHLSINNLMRNRFAHDNRCSRAYKAGFRYGLCCWRGRLRAIPCPYTRRRADDWRAGYDDARAKCFAQQAAS